MRLITIEELQCVAGSGLDVGELADSAQVGAAVGGGLGIGIAQKAGVQGGARLLVATGFGASVGAAVTASFTLGYAAGTWLNENTGIQDWISTGIDSGGRILDTLDFSFGGGGLTDASYFQNVSSV